MKLTSLIPLLAAALGMARAADSSAFTVTMSPSSTVVQREGITGAGQVVMDAAKRITVNYPNHPDDFGGSGGTGTSHSADGGITWTQGPDDWPLPKMVDLWQDRLRNGEMIAFGIRWVPDPKKRGEITAQDVPANAYQIAITKDQGRTWQTETAMIECPAQFGVIARPLPHVFEDEKGALFMPAYAWGKHGNHALLLTSADRGRHWTVLSSITTAAAMVKAGAPVTTPWLETTVSPAKNGDWLAVVRTGSSAQSSLVSLRSADHGRSWSTPEKLPIAGKLPTLQLLPNGMLALLTAHSKNHCRLHLSPDGTGRDWGGAQILTSQCGGNAGMTVIDDHSLLVITPANRRIDAWRVTIRPKAGMNTALPSPANISFSKGVLSWSASTGTANYQIRPILLKPAASYTDTEVHPHAVIQTSEPRLDLSRQLLIGGTYQFEITAVDPEGRVSPATSSAQVVMLP
jgi:hypothetical protein